jgi:hypothetical protein
MKKKKKTTRIAAATLVLAGMAFLAGCGGSSEQTGSAQAQAGNSSQQAGNPGMTVSEPDLTNVPIYPGAEKETMTAGVPGAGPGAGGGMPTPPSDGTGGSGNMPTPPSGGMGSGGTPPSMSMVRYKTSGSTDTVVAWYRQQLSGKDGFTESTGTFGRQGGSGSGATQTMFSFKNGDTTITITIGAATQGQGATASGTSIMFSEGTPPAQPSGQSR